VQFQCLVPEALLQYLREEEDEAASSTRIGVHLQSQNQSQILMVLATLYKLASESEAKNVFGEDIQPENPESYDDLVEPRQKFSEEEHDVFEAQRTFVFRDQVGTESNK